MSIIELTQVDIDAWVWQTEYAPAIFSASLHLAHPSSINIISLTNLAGEKGYILPDSGRICAG